MAGMSNYYNARIVAAPPEAYYKLQSPSTKLTACQIAMLFSNVPILIPVIYAGRYVTILPQYRDIESQEEFVVPSYMAAMARTFPGTTLARIVNPRTSQHAVNCCSVNTPW